MKFVSKTFLALAAIIMIISACSDDITYAKELEAERDLIADFIKRNNIKVVETLPEIWPENEKIFYKTKSGLYFRLTEVGDTTTIVGDSTIKELEAGDRVSLRFLQYTLNVKADTINNMSTTDFSSPSVFNYADLTQVNEAWHEAVSLMKYQDAEATILVRSKLNFDIFSSPATPIGYDLKMRFQK